jgi:uncharacterized membrane protein YccC
MHWIIGLVIAVICAILCFMYLPSPINWVVGLVILAVVAVAALQTAPPRRL